MTNTELVRIAIGASEKAYSPYSRCRVGAALLTKSGKVYTGCNIENASFGATVCAERTAVFKAVSEGETEFEKIAVYGSGELKDGGYFYPCGICRQVLSEFCGGGFTVITARSEGDYKTNTLDELFANGFGF